MRKFRWPPSQSSPSGEGGRQKSNLAHLNPCGTFPHWGKAGMGAPRAQASSVKYSGRLPAMTLKLRSKWASSASVMP